MWLLKSGNLKTNVIIRLKLSTIHRDVAYFCWKQLNCSILIVLFLLMHIELLKCVCLWKPLNLLCGIGPYVNTGIKLPCVIIKCPIHHVLFLYFKHCHSNVISVRYRLIGYPLFRWWNDCYSIVYNIFDLCVVIKCSIHQFICYMF